MAEERSGALDLPHRVRSTFSSPSGTPTRRRHARNAEEFTDEGHPAGDSRRQAATPSRSRLSALARSHSPADARRRPEQPPQAPPRDEVIVVASSNAPWTDLDLGDLLNGFLQAGLLVLFVWEIACDLQLLLLFTSAQFRSWAQASAAQGNPWSAVEVNTFFYHVVLLLATGAWQLLSLFIKASSLLTARRRTTTTTITVPSNMEPWRRHRAVAEAQARLEQERQQRRTFPVEAALVANVVLGEWPKVAALLSLVNRLYVMRALCSPQDAIFYNDFFNNVFSQDAADAIGTSFQRQGVSWAFSGPFPSPAWRFGAPLPPSPPPPGAMVYDVAPPPLACLNNDLVYQIEGSLLLTCINCIGTMLKFWLKESRLPEDAVLMAGLAALATPLFLHRPLTGMVAWAQVQGRFALAYTLAWNRYERLALASMALGLVCTAATLWYCAACGLHVRLLAFFRGAPLGQQPPGLQNAMVAVRERDALEAEVRRLREQIRLGRRRPDSDDDGDASDVEHGARRAAAARDTEPERDARGKPRGSHWDGYLRRFEPLSSRPSQNNSKSRRPSLVSAESHQGGSEAPLASRTSLASRASRRLHATAWGDEDHGGSSRELPSSATPASQRSGSGSTATTSGAAKGSDAVLPVAMGASHFSSSSSPARAAPEHTAATAGAAQGLPGQAADQFGQAGPQQQQQHWWAQEEVLSPGRRLAAGPAGSLSAAASDLLPDGRHQQAGPLGEALEDEGRSEGSSQPTTPRLDVMAASSLVHRVFRTFDVRRPDAPVPPHAEGASGSTSGGAGPSDGGAKQPRFVVLGASSPVPSPTSHRTRHVTHAPAGPSSAAARGASSSRAGEQRGGGGGAGLLGGATVQRRAEASFVAHKRAVLESVEAQRADGARGRPNDCGPMPEERAPQDRRGGAADQQRQGQGVAAAVMVERNATAEEVARERELAIQHLRAGFYKTLCVPLVLLALASLAVCAANIGVLQADLGFETGWLYGDIAGAVIQAVLVGGIAWLVASCGILHDGVGGPRVAAA